jgi:PPM family protein phosphatase
VLRAYGLTEKGRVRATNEDAFALDEDRQFLIVADGMGGHNAGEVAARMAVTTVGDFLSRDARGGGTWPFGVNPLLSEAGNRLRNAIHAANLQIFEAATSEDSYAGMGTTIVVATIAGDRLSVGHVGDSRLYLLANNRLVQLTRDDSWLASVLQQDLITDPVALREHPMRHVLTSVVGTSRRTEVHIVEHALVGGELLLLTTDGVHATLDQERITRVMLDGHDVEQMANELVAEALQSGSRDNCTAVVARYSPD